MPIIVPCLTRRHCGPPARGLTFVLHFGPGTVHTNLLDVHRVGHRTGKHSSLRAGRSRRRVQPGTRLQLRHWSRCGSAELRRSAALIR
jgi:hypothetical protein